MATKTVDQIIQDAITFINTIQPNITTLVGSVVHDVVISSPAQEFEKIYTELTRVSEIQSLEFPDVMTSEELDAFADNYGMTRNAGTPAQGTVTFRVVGLQTIEPNIIISVGTVVSTQQTATAPIVTFATTQAGTFIAAQASSFFNPLTGFYELTLPIQAQTVGTTGNVAAGAINILSSSIPRIFSVTNSTAGTGGTNQESNDDFAARIRLKLSGNNLGTVPGLQSLILTDPNVEDVAIVGPNDPEMLRNEFGGSIDVYILGTNSVSTTDTNVFTTTGPRTFVLQHQPATVASGSVTISGTVGGGPYVFIQDTDYVLVSDPTTLFNGSTRLQSAIRFLNTGTLPDTSTNFSTTYSYNKLIETLQNTVNNDGNHIIGSDILIKEATTAIITISLSISVLSGFVAADVISAVQTALTNFINNNLLGQSFNQSDIVGVVEQTAGVDEVDLTTIVITKNAVQVTTQKVTIDKTEYTTLTGATISILI